MPAVSRLIMAAEKPGPLRLAIAFSIFLRAMNSASTREL
jgi:hypothetical protein